MYCTVPAEAGELQVTARLQYAPGKVPGTYLLLYPVRTTIDRQKFKKIETFGRWRGQKSPDADVSRRPKECLCKNRNVRVPNLKLDFCKDQ